MTMILYAFAAVAVMVAGALAFAPRAELATHVQIDAPPSAVWAVLAEPASYGEWNPFLVSMEGELTEGATLTNTMRPSNGTAMIFRPTVLAVVAERELRWLGRLLLPRLFDGEHYFLLRANERGTLLVHGERFHGIGLWFIDVEGFRIDFEAMNAALKKRAEAKPGPSAVSRL